MDFQIQHIDTNTQLVINFPVYFDLKFYF